MNNSELMYFARQKQIQEEREAQTNAVRKLRLMYTRQAEKEREQKNQKKNQLLKLIKKQRKRDKKENKSFWKDLNVVDNIRDFVVGTYDTTGKVYDIGKQLYTLMDKSTQYDPQYFYK